MTKSDLRLPAGVALKTFVDAAEQAKALSTRVAQGLRSALEQRGQATLVVSGGRSPVPFFESLSAAPLDWSRVLVSLADERWVAPDHPASNEALVRRHLLQGAAADARFLGLYQPAGDLAAAAAQADRRFADVPLPLDVLVLGMGDDGHTASLFPESPGLEDGLDVRASRRCLPMQAPGEPRARITLTRAVLASARLPILSIQGVAKREVLSQALSEGPEAELPIRAFLRAPLEIYWCP